MLHSLKKRLYFVAAAYFGFWAKFVLRRWKPRVVLITGSSGKTTLLHMVEAQIGDQAIYSHDANSAFGISFQLLGMPPNVPSHIAWLKYFLKAPLGVFQPAPTQKLYIVEADTDRPKEGSFTSNLTKPEVVMWVSVSRTHSMNFDRLVKSGAFATHDEAIAYEFGNFAAAASKLVLANGDYQLINDQLKRVSQAVTVQKASMASVEDYQLSTNATKFKIGGQTISLPGLHPKETGASLQMLIALLKYLNLPFDPGFSKFHLPPGRNNLLVGKNSTIIIDSTYNTGLGATVALLTLFAHYPADSKWLVIGDILEQGSLEKDEHEKLAREIIAVKPAQIVLLGKRTKTYTFPVLQKEASKLAAVSFDTPKEVLDFLNVNLKGGEAILFKGAQGLEGVIEQLLANPADEAQLVRRSASWTKRRQTWGLPK